MSSAKLRNQLLNGSGLVLTTARVPDLVTCVAAATDPASSATAVCISAGGAAEQGHRHQCAANRPDHSVHGVPDRIDPGHFVRHELDRIHRQGDADDDRDGRTIGTAPAASPTGNASTGRAPPPWRTG